MIYCLLLLPPSPPPSSSKEVKIVPLPLPGQLKRQETGMNTGVNNGGTDGIKEKNHKVSQNLKHFDDFLDGVIQSLPSSSPTSSLQSLPLPLPSVENSAFNGGECSHQMKRDYSISSPPFEEGKGSENTTSSFSLEPVKLQRSTPLFKSCCFSKAEDRSDIREPLILGEYPQNLNGDHDPDGGNVYIEETHNNGNEDDVDEDDVGFIVGSPKMLIKLKIKRESKSY